MVGRSIPSRDMLTHKTRVEKYRPNTLDDVSGHQDILATINKFVDSNVEITVHLLMQRADDMPFSDCRISSYTDRLGPAKRPPF